MVGKKKRGHPDVEDLLQRPWCYYCERDFDDLKILISHQKAKHFKCERCGRRLNTAGGLSVHMNQVHKETLTNVENALPNRQGLEVEIFGMEGIPEEVVQAHNQRIIAGFYQAEAERRAATGNPGPGGGNGGQAKKPKFESPGDLKKRLAEHKARKLEQAANASSGNNTPMQGHTSPPGQSPAPFNGSPYVPPQPTYGTQGAGYGSFTQEPYAQPTAAYQQPVSGPPGAQYQPQYSPPQQYPAQQSFPPTGYSQPHQNFPGGPPPFAGSPPGSFGGYQAPPAHTPPQLGGLPNRPSSLPPPPGLPQRPSFGAPPVANYQMQQIHQGSQHHQQGSWGGNNGWNGQDQKSAMSSAYPPHSQGYGDYPTNASTVDDMAAGATREPDEYDEAIRMAIAGIKPPKKIDAPPGAAQPLPTLSAPPAPLSIPAPVVVPVAAPQSVEPVIEKKSKKDKPMKMIYSDNEISPEERMAALARYAYVPEKSSESALLDTDSAAISVDA